MVLFINTSGEKTIDVFLIKNKQILDSINVKGNYKISERLLKIINEILSRNNHKITQLSGLITVTGPGPFTSLRIAISVANTLAFILKIPICGIKNINNRHKQTLIKQGLNQLDKKNDQFLIRPFYNKEPNIT